VCIKLVTYQKLFSVNSHSVLELCMYIHLGNKMLLDGLKFLLYVIRYHFNKSRMLIFFSKLTVYLCF